MCKKQLQQAALSAVPGLRRVGPGKLKYMELDEEEKDVLKEIGAAMERAITDQM